MTTKEQIAMWARAEFEKWADSTQPAYWRTTAWARDAWQIFLEAATLVRNAALEEAAQVCESRQTPGTASVAILTGAADAIRNLKEPT